MKKSLIALILITSICQAKNINTTNILCGNYVICTEKNIKSCQMIDGDFKFFVPEKSNTNGVAIATYKFIEGRMGYRSEFRNSVICKYQILHTDGSTYGVSFSTKYEYDCLPKHEYSNWTSNKSCYCASHDPSLCPIIAKIMVGY